VRYWILAGVSAFSAFALFAAVGSLAARAGAGFIARISDGAPAGTRARRLFRLRLLPATAAFIAAFAIALPIFLWFEEPGTGERVSLTLALAGGFGGFLLLRGVSRAAAAWLATIRVVGNWRRRGRPLDGLAVPMPAFAVDEPFPIVAVAGIVRPQLFVAERVLQECTAAEIAAMVSHECAHVSARDNIKRLVIRACPDVFGVPCRLDRAWAAAAEEAADAFAAARAPSARFDLAQALIRVARLAAPHAPELVSAFYLGGSVDTRVRRLVVAEPVAAPAVSPRVLIAAAVPVSAAVLIVAAPYLHALMEQAVRFLP
jgi:hypothetical protein